MRLARTCPWPALLALLACTKPEAEAPAVAPASRTATKPVVATSTRPLGADELFATPDLEGGVVAKVGGETIPREALEKKLRGLRMQLEAAGLPSGLTRAHVLRSAVDQLVEAALTRQIAAGLGVGADPALVKAWLADVEARVAKDPAFGAFLERAGVDAAQRRQDAELAALEQGVARKLGARIRTKTATAVEAYYDKRKADFTRPAGREVWRITVKAPRNLPERDRAAARKTAERVHAEASASRAAFEQLAITHSEGGKGPQGGYIGVVPPGTFAPELDAQIVAAEPGSILPLYEDAGGYYIYKVGSFVPELVRTLDEVREEIFDRLYRTVARREVEAEKQKLAAALGVEILVPELRAP